MIGQIRGILIEKAPPNLIIETNGVGYEIDAPMSTFYRLPEIGQEVSLLTHFVVREDAQLLYGFYTRDERVLFRTLLKVNGVGPRLALTILSSAEPEEFVQSILNNDTQRLVRMPGVGKKTAERLVIEMRDKLKDFRMQGASPNMHKMQSLPIAGVTRHQTIQDAIAALIALGFKPAEANRVVTKVDDGEAASEELIRCALREMM